MIKAILNIIFTSNNYEFINKHSIYIVFYDSTFISGGKKKEKNIFLF